MVALPKEWARRVELGRGSEVLIQELPDGTLRILAGEAAIPSAQVDVGGMQRDQILRILIGLYLQGVSRIRVVTEEVMPLEVRRAVREFSRRVMGMEVVEEGRNYAVLMDLSSSETLPFGEGVRRMVDIANAMILDAADAVEDGSSVLAEDVIERDDELDRLYWFLRRKATIEIARCCKPGPIEDLLVARTLERIGDHAARICYSMLEEGGSVSEDLITALRNSSFELLEASDSYLGGSFQKANEQLARLKETVAKLRGVRSFASTLEYVVQDSTIRILLYTSDLDELAIDRSSKKYIGK